MSSKHYADIHEKFAERLYKNFQSEIDQYRREAKKIRDNIMSDYEYQRILTNVRDYLLQSAPFTDAEWKLEFHEQLEDFFELYDHGIVSGVENLFQ